MSHRRTVTTARSTLHDVMSDLHGVQLDTASEQVAGEIATARAQIERAMGRLTDALAEIDA